MARLEFIDFQLWRENIHEQSLSWVKDGLAAKIDGLPQVFWSDGQGWHEANHWALEKTLGIDTKLDTVKSLMKHLHQYAVFLEANGCDWRHFPMRIAERAVVRFRGYLTDQINRGVLSSSTAKARMNAVIQFYRHAQRHSFVDTNTPLWQERAVVLRWYDALGFQRSMQRVSTDLSIRNRSCLGVRLEDGLLPISEEHMNALLRSPQCQKNQELKIMLMIGFFTGARIGTITTLRIDNVECARPDPFMKDFSLIEVGPGTGVATKFNIKGNLLVPDFIIDCLKNYAESVERLKREAKARKGDRTILFLTSRGGSYKGSSISRLMTDLRRSCLSAGLQFMEKFKFHQTRATYGTWLMKLALRVTTPAAAIEFVKDAMHHKREETTFRYVRFLEVSKGKEEVAAEFSKAFTGIQERNWNCSRV